MASNAAMTLTADSKADRKSAENTTFQHRSCVYFRRSPYGVKIRVPMKIRGRKCRIVRKIGVFSGVATKNQKISPHFSKLNNLNPKVKN